ncbi:MAG TPA: Gfo/Idh/MocA family oxidoreductase [Pyrinomonadaceae bacterium]|nr:Gfo/Idh/MocA family oxidoreductase [Pyrinomonadaceae bacterium]
MKEKIGIGFIGTGFARKVQLPAFKMCENAEIISVASASLSNAKSTAKEFNIPHWTDNWRETIEHKDVDLVCITTPPDLHCEQTLYALDHNKHILCEKPMAMTVAEAQKMCEAAREKGVMALIDHELRFQNGRQKAFQMLRNGEIGKIRHIKYVFRNAQRGNPDILWNWWSDENQGGGTLGAIGSHAIDTMRWFLGTEISSVFCQLQTHVKQRKDANDEIKQVTSDDETNIILRFADSDLTEDATGNVSLSMVEFPDYQHSIEFVGTEGSLKVLYLGEIYLTKKGEENWTPIEVELERSVDGIFNSGFPSGFVAFAKRIVDALQAGETEIPHAATFEDGLRVQEILDAARESNSNGCLIKI